jgi:hypothetical protein
MPSEGRIVRFARLLRQYEQAPFGIAILLGAISELGRAVL